MLAFSPEPDRTMTTAVNPRREKLEKSNYKAGQSYGIRLKAPVWNSGNLPISLLAGGALALRHRFTAERTQIWLVELRFIGNFFMGNNAIPGYQP